MAVVIHVRGLAPERDTVSLTIADLSSSVALVASQRLYDSLLHSFAEDLLPPLIPLLPLKKSLKEIEKTLVHGDVTILASGDPLFYGIGRMLLEAFPKQKISFHPALSSMQLCFARFAISWDDAHFVSLHGRSGKRMVSQLVKEPKVFVFTDPKHSPDMIAGKLLQECGEKVLADTRVYVAENLGAAEERLFRGSLQEIAAAHFADPNVMILLNNTETDDKDFSFGLQEDEIQHSRGLITKNEVRAVLIHSLRLPDSGVMWDVGAGSGSVGLECARMCPNIQVVAIEREEEQWQNIESNREHFAVWNLELVKGTAPQSLENLPAPVRIFVGGSGGDLQKILEFAVNALLPGGIIVVNAVISKTAKLAPAILHELGLDVEIKEVAVTRYTYPQVDRKPFNPITIVVGKKRDRS